MHITIRRYHIEIGHSEKLVEMIQEEFLPIMRRTPKFISYHAFHEGDGDVSSVSVFEDEESALASNQIANEWVMRRLSEHISVPPQIISGNVVAQLVRAEDQALAAS